MTKNNPVVNMDATFIQIFNEDGKLVSESHYNQKTRLCINSSEEEDSFTITNATIELPLLTATARKIDNSSSDFDNAIKNVKNTVTYNFKKEPYNERFKIVASGVLYDRESSVKTHEFKIVIHSAKLASGFEIKGECGEVFTPTYKFIPEETLDGKYADFTVTEL